MAKQASVPKFGNWETTDDVTQYFDNARKGKIAGKPINPNDPEENPKSFNKPYSLNPPPGSPLRPDAVARKLAGPDRRVNRISAGSDRSLEQSPLHPNYHVRNGARVGVNSPVHGLAPNTPGRSRARAGGRGDETPKKRSAVPKFGEWDESNPASADEFSQIFKKVSEEKQVGSAMFPAMSKESSFRKSPKPVKSGFESSQKCGCFGWLKN